MKKSLISAALAVSLGMASFSASAEFLDFTIDESSVPGSTGGLLTGDKLNGGYSELLTINNDFTFDTVAFASIGQLFGNEGTPPALLTQLACGIAPNCYNMYAVFTSSGSVNPGTGVFTGSSGEFRLFIDPTQNTNFAFGATGADPLALVGTADDYEIAFSTNLIQALGIVGNPGAFDLTFEDFQLTTEGADYFVSPDPFHMRVVVDGDFDEFVVAPGNIVVTGDVSAVFAVPEPATLSLIGLGLLGAGFSSRRRKA